MASDFIYSSLGRLDSLGDDLDYMSGVEALLNGSRLTPIRVAWLLPEQARAIGAHSREVLLSSYTAMKLGLKKKYPPVDLLVALPRPSIWEKLPLILTYGECRKIEERKLVFLWSSRLATHKPYKAIVKATRNGKFLFVDSAYRIQPDQVRRTVASSIAVKSQMIRPKPRP